jgi:ferric-dicitrate binding protein FerR (iron transport regulator)
MGGTVSVRLYQRGSLIDATRQMVEHWRSASESTRHTYAIAATIIGQAAVVAILNEWAERSAPDIYQKYKDAGVVTSAAVCAAAAGVVLPNGLKDLSDAKNALAHAEPDNERSFDVGAWVGGAGAESAYRVVMEFDALFFPGGNPRPANP